MSRLFLCVFFFIFVSAGLSGIQEVFEDYVVIYGEGPFGQHPVGFDVINYTKDDAERIAMDEIAYYMAGIIYGYSFEYQIESPIDGRKDFFELKPSRTMSVRDPFFEFRQYEISQISIRVQGTYRLNTDQKSYIKGFRGGRMVTSSGESNDQLFQEWSNRYAGFELAVKNAILNHARAVLKSRPLSIIGKVTLRESPKFYIVSGAWVVRVKINLLIEDIEYVTAN